jgi:hypothetical protein
MRAGGRRASSWTRDGVVRAERYCEVLWVMRGAARAAGVLLEEQRDELRMVVVGMVDRRESTRRARSRRRTTSRSPKPSRAAGAGSEPAGRGRC